MSPSPFPGFPALETERCRLVQPEPDHARFLLEIFGDEETMRYMQSPPARTLEDCHRMLGDWERDREGQRGLRWLILPREAPESPLGVFALHDWSARNRRAELGSYLHRRAWGRGFSTEATRAVLRFAFEELELHRVEIRCDPRNTASTVIAERAGLKLEGILRDYVQVEGKGFVDEAVYALLETEWTGALR